MNAENMTLEQKLGQMFLTGFPSETPSERWKKLISDYQIGNVILFRYNLSNKEQIRNLTDEVCRYTVDACGIQPIIAADEEGGVVSRLPDSLGRLPSAMAMSSLEDPKIVETAAKKCGEQLKALGINMNLAPVLDINSNKKNPVIGVRSYGTTKEQVIRYAVPALLGYEKAGIISCGKHFPGHGDTSVDSHLALPKEDRTLDELKKRELVPFQAAVKEGIPAIMSAHILFPGSDMPATMSYEILTKILREEMEFHGLILTDCMEMDAIAGHYNAAEAALAAVQAGADIICFSRTPERVEAAAEALKNAINAGEISEGRINASVNRILAVKMKYMGTNAEKADSFDFSQMKHYCDELAAESIQKSRNRDGKFNLGRHPVFIAPDKKRSSLVVNRLGKELNFAESMQNRYGGDRIVIPPDPDQVCVDRILGEVEGCSGIVMGVMNGAIHESQIRLAGLLHDTGIPTAYVSLRDPFDVELFPEGAFHLALYEYSERTIEDAMNYFTAEG